MDDRGLKTFVQQQLATASLPTGRIVRAWLSRGDRTQCSACAELLAWEQPMIEGFTTTGAVFRFHLGCFDLWAAPRSPCPPDPPLPPLT
jgi:hypothetical protein